MDTTLLKHLGVHEAVLQALEKSWGSGLDELEIEQGENGLRLILRGRGGEGTRVQQVISLRGVFPAAGVSEAPEIYQADGKKTGRCRDLLELLGAGEGLEPNVAINGRAFRLGDSLYRLLAKLAREKQARSPGWISIPDLRAARVIPSDGYQIFSRLRGAVAGYLLEKNARDFIESNGSKAYRLSIPAENIRFAG